MTEPDVAYPMWACLPQRTAIQQAIDTQDMATIQAIGRINSQRSGQRETWALIRAGWRFEWPEHDHSESWSWRWRRPPKRAGKPGRLYPSTGQAYNAMTREDEGN